jgi:hypothetical protein
MDYLLEAFGGFNPQSDQDAAVKFVLNIIWMDERLSELSSLLTDGHEIGGMTGEPRWIIERKDTGLSGEYPFYADWPKNTHFHVRVEPRAYELVYPDIFMGTGEFHRYVRKVVDVYLTRNISNIDLAKSIISQLKEPASNL